MKKRIVMISSILLGILLLGLGIYQGIQYYRIKHAKIIVKLVDNLTVEVYEKRKISDFIQSINGKILHNRKIDTTKIGKQEISFQYINDDGIKVPYQYDIAVVDKTEPIIWLNSQYQLKVNSDIDLTSSILCGDNYDDHPNCRIEGEYHLDQVGIYPLTYKATDQSGNEATQEFNLTVYEPTKSSQNSSVEEEKTQFEDIIKNYKTSHTKIGVDISKWQEEVDFQKMKNAGVEFVMIRVGTKDEEKDQYILDPYFNENIQGAIKEGLEVGVYFYSYADSIKEATQDAKWVIKQIKNYDITLPVAFDWEDWRNYNSHQLSFYHLTLVGETFMKEIEKHGYQSVRYGSKNYLEQIFLETEYGTWLAHYTDQTTYQGTYQLWQICQNGRVDGIHTDVDIDILYKEK